ncbi:MAG: biopolymer transporter ExbD [Proteobacteria bacterium]|nr:biopolymer transporter ExbD [Pseudomonadota bacterium]MBU1715265.1 biopolymer transporter ExbD [Pseudomonadota bacterium]
MKVNLPVNPKARIEMLPLIDIVFLLLVFFIYAMLSMAVHKGLPVDLPASASASLAKEMTLSVTVKAGGENLSDKIYVDEQEVPLAELTEILKAKAGQADFTGALEPGVLLFADQTINYQKLFLVLDRINQAGLSKISLQADVDQ